MEKIRIQRDELYTIEISDDGKVITLDPLDTDFPMRIDKAFREIEKNNDLLQQRFVVIDKQEDKMRHGIYSQNDYEKLEAYHNYNVKNREIFDNLFGEGTCQALFGESNYIGMYNDLIDALQPHIEKVYGNVSDIREYIKRKYSKKSDDVLR